MDISARLSIAVTDGFVEALLIKGQPIKPVITDAWVKEIDRDIEIKDFVKELSQTLKDPVATVVTFHSPSSVHEQLYMYGKDENVKVNIYRDLKRDFDIELKENWVSYESAVCGDNICVYAGCFPISKGNFYYRAFSGKLRVNAFETFTISLKRGIYHLYPDETVLACMTYKNYSKILLTKNRRILAVKDIKFSWDEMVNRTAEVLKKSIPDTISFLRTSGFEKADGVDDSVYMTMADVLDPLISGLQSVYDYVKSAKSVFGSVDRVVLMGDVTNIRYVDAYVERVLDLETKKSYLFDLADIGEGLTMDFLKTMKFLDVLVGASMRRVR